MNNIQPCKPCQNGISGRVDRNVNDRTYRDYNLLRNKPSIEGVQLIGDLGLADFGITTIYSDTTENWNSKPTMVADKGALYIYQDYDVDGQGNILPGFKVGDGTSYLIDMPFSDALMKSHMADEVIHITAEEREFWNNKNRCYVDGETLVATKN